MVSFDDVSEQWEEVAWELFVCGGVERAKDTRGCGIGFEGFTASSVPAVGSSERVQHFVSELLCGLWVESPECALFRDTGFGPEGFGVECVGCGLECAVFTFVLIGLSELENVWGCRFSFNFMIFLDVDACDRCVVFDEVIDLDGGEFVKAFDNSVSFDEGLVSLCDCFCCVEAVLVPFEGSVNFREDGHGFMGERDDMDGTGRSVSERTLHE